MIKIGDKVIFDSEINPDYVHLNGSVVKVLAIGDYERKEIGFEDQIALIEFDDGMTLDVEIHEELKEIDGKENDMSGMLDKLKENGINVEFIMTLPSVWTSILMILLVMIASVISNSWFEFIIYLCIMLAWMLGVFFGFKLLLLRVELIDTDEG